MALPLSEGKNVISEGVEIQPQNSVDNVNLDKIDLDNKNHVEKIVDPLFNAKNQLR